MKTLMAFPLLFVSMALGQQSLYINSPLPNSHPLKKELVEKLKQSGKVVIVTLSEKADLILDLEQSGRGVRSCNGNIANVILSSACGNRGKAVLKSRQTGEELWSEEKGGPYQWSGFSAAKVGRKLGDDLIKFLSQNAPASVSRSTDPLVTHQAAPKVIAPPIASAPAPGAATPPTVSDPAPKVAASPPSSKPKDSTQRPTEKCPQGTYWGDSPSGEPVCVWSH
jgi:hypothetical protein